MLHYYSQPIICLPRLKDLNHEFSGTLDKKNIGPSISVSPDFHQNISHLFFHLTLRTWRLLKALLERRIYIFFDAALVHFVLRRLYIPKNAVSYEFFSPKPALRRNLQFQRTGSLTVFQPNEERLKSSKSTV